MSDLIRHLRRRMRDYRAEDRWTEPAHFSGEAAVLIGCTRADEPEIILTRRADSLKSHSGEVALPGGKIDPEDRDPVHAALRETHEEVGIEPARVEVLGPIDPMVTRFGMKVTPVVGLLPAEVELVPNPAELDSAFTVPLAFFFEDRRLRTDVGTVGGHKVQVPCWEYQGYEIWGVTAVILVNLLNRVFDRNIETGMEQAARRSGGRFSPEDWRSVGRGDGSGTEK